MTHRGKALAMSAKQALQVVASLAQAISAINPSPELVQKMIGSPRYLQDRLRMLLENPVPEKAAIDDKSWKLSPICEKIEVGRAGEHFKTEIFDFGKEARWKDEWQNVRAKKQCWRLVHGGVVHGYVTNKDFKSIGELLRAALNTEDDRFLYNWLRDRGLLWDISQITPFLCDYIWDGKNPLNLLTDGTRNHFFVEGPEGKVELASVSLKRWEGVDTWEFSSAVCREYDFDFIENTEGRHVYFRNDPAAYVPSHSKKH